MLEAVEEAGVFGGYLEDLCYTPKTLKAVALGARRARSATSPGSARARRIPGRIRRWFWDGRLTGGGAIIDLGCHCIEIIRNFVGKGNRPVEVLCHTDTLVHPIADEDNAIALIRFESGAIGQFEVSWTFRGGMDLRDEVAGTHGTIWLNHFLRTGFEMFTRRRRAAATSPRRPRRRPAGCSRSATRCPSSATSTCSATCSGRSTRAGRRRRRSTTATSSTRSWTPPIARRRRTPGSRSSSTGAAADAPRIAHDARDVRGPGRHQARDPARRPAQADPQGPGVGRLHRPGRRRRLSASGRTSNGATDQRRRVHGRPRARTGAPPCEEMRRTINAAAPEANETIAYSMPALRKSWRQILVSYAAYKKHYSLFPASGAVVASPGGEAGAVPGRARDDPVPGRQADPARSGAPDRRDPVRRERRCGKRAEPVQPVWASATSGAPDGSPASIQRAIESRANSWSTTIADAPMTPARPPSDERWMSRSRVASGSERR